MHTHTNTQHTCDIIYESVSTANGFEMQKFTTFSSLSMADFFAISTSVGVHFQCASVLRIQFVSQHLSLVDVYLIQFSFCDGFKLSTRRLTIWKSNARDIQLTLLCWKMVEIFARFFHCQVQETFSSRAFIHLMLIFSLNCFEYSTFYSPLCRDVCIRQMPFIFTPSLFNQFEHGNFLIILLHWWKQISLWIMIDVCCFIHSSRKLFHR